MGSFRQFCQQEPLQEGLLSRVTSFFKKPKKTKERPTDVETSKTRSYRTYNDIDPADVPTFKPSFSVKKEDEELELEEGRAKFGKAQSKLNKDIRSANRKLRKAVKATKQEGGLEAGPHKLRYYIKARAQREKAAFNRMVGEESLEEGRSRKKIPGERFKEYAGLNRKMRKANKTSSDVKYKSYQDRHSDRHDKRYGINEDCGVEKQANGKANQKPTKDKNDKKEFFMKFSQFRRKEIKEGRARFGKETTKANAYFKQPNRKARKVIKGAHGDEATGDKFMKLAAKLTHYRSSHLKRKKAIEEGRAQPGKKLKSQWSTSIKGVDNEVVNRKVRKAVKSAAKTGAYSDDKNTFRDPRFAKVDHYIKKSNYRYDNPKD